LGDCLLWALFENYKSSQNCWSTFSHVKSYVSSLTKTGLGYILGIFFTNSSGHPACGRRLEMDNRIACQASLGQKCFN
jgi:hypothetical protein